MSPQHAIYLHLQKSNYFGQSKPVSKFVRKYMVGSSLAVVQSCFVSSSALRLCKLKCGFRFDHVRFDHVRLKTSCLQHPLMSFFDHQGILFCYNPSVADWPRQVRSNFLRLDSCTGNTG